MRRGAQDRSTGGAMVSTRNPRRSRLAKEKTDSKDKPKVKPEGSRQDTKKPKPTCRVWTGGGMGELPEPEGAELLGGLSRESGGETWGTGCPGLVAQTLLPFLGPEYPFYRQTLTFLMIEYICV